jgi:asparagine synthase (glutamine-hydrolysing)
MCGIAGVLASDGQIVTDALLDRMASSLKHRGPDDHGVFVDRGNPTTALVSRRLAVIDIVGGAQPMSTEDNEYTIVYNGEIYNAGEMRASLEARGHRFRSRCDTEVVLKGYSQWGPEVLNRLNGMWAFAVWDRGRRRLFAARDRLGVKPFVYAIIPTGLVFGSEIKALLASGLIQPSLDLSVLPYYLSSFVAAEPYSFFRGVRRLPSGHYLQADEKGVREVSYWDCTLEEEPDQGEDHYCEEVAALLEDSVRRRLVSDVPVGVFLSGGVDSAVVASSAAQHTRRPLRTFTLGFEGSSHDERADARLLARRLGAEHVDGIVTAREAAAALPDLLQAHDEPSQSLVQSAFISRLARSQVTVALSGIGGDELFSSYPTHRVVAALARFDRLSGELRRLLLTGAGFLGPRGRHFVELARMEPDERVSTRLMHLTDAGWRRRLLARDVREAVDLDAPIRHMEAHLQRSRAAHPLNRLLYLYVKTYLPDELLRTLDTMSMRYSLEAREPLLDYRLVERAMRIPARHKSSLSAGKLLLRRVAEKTVPGGLTSAAKRGFALPLDVWLQRELAERLRDVLSTAAVKRRGVFDPDAVRGALDGSLSGDSRLIPAVMMAFAFEQWALRVLDRPPTPMGPRVVEIVSASGSAEVSVVIVNWNTREILRACLQSLERHLSAVRHEVIVVDNASSDGSPDMVREDFPTVRLIANRENVGFARANNQAMRVATGRRFLLLNSDTLLTDDSVAQFLLSGSVDPGVGVWHCRLVLPDGRTQESAYRFPRLDLAILEEMGLYKLLPRRLRGRLLLGGYWSYDEERDVDWVAGAFMLLPRAVFEQTGGFSEAFFMYGEDMEWALRIRDAGWRIRYVPGASIQHLDHASSEQRWGEQRVTICVQRQIQIYRSRSGRIWTGAFVFVHIIGTAARWAYFALRSLRPSTKRDHYRATKRHYAVALKAYASMVRRAR